MLQTRPCFPEHPDCDWRVGKTATRTYRGTPIGVLHFVDQSCDSHDSLPLSANGQYVLIGDGLRETMGWKRKKFIFATAEFMEVVRHEDYGVSAYIVTYYHANEYGTADWSEG